MLSRLKSHLKGKVVILGIGNTLRCDDAAGSILAQRLKEKTHFIVFDAGQSPENYLEKIIREKADIVVIIDSADFGGSAGEFKVLKAEDIKTVNLFSTHNTSISLTINYLKNNLKADIIILIIQPKSIAFGDKLSPELDGVLNKLVGLFYAAGKKKG